MSKDASKGDAFSSTIISKKPLKRGNKKRGYQYWYFLFFCFDNSLVYIYISKPNPMVEKPNNFWQELKRRKVVRIITVYAAAAFVILELVDIISEPFGLPSWTFRFVFVLLAIGFVISIIFSWVYDITPEGIQKTKPINEISEQSKGIPSKKTGWKVATYASVVIIAGLLVINLVGIRNKSEVDTKLEKSLAVLPFNNLSEEKGNEHFTDGLVEDLLNRLSTIEELKVISRTSSAMYYERGIKSVPEIANELGVSYIVEGSVQRYEDKARITVQLIDAINDNHIWSEEYDREIVDVFKTQSDIAIQVVSELKMILTSGQKTHIKENKTTNVEAFELYQMGRFYWNKRTGDGYNKSIEYFEKAIDEDPDYGLAYAGLADTYSLMTMQRWIDKQEGRGKAMELALKALELDSNLAEAYTVLGSIYDHIDRDWENAEWAYKRAIEINPNDATTYQYYSEYLCHMGKLEEARKYMDKAIKLSPLSFVIRYYSAHIYYHLGLFNEALAEIQLCNELNENHPWLVGSYLDIYWQLGEDEKLFELLWKIFTEPPIIHDLDSVKKIYSESGIRGVIVYDLELMIKESKEVDGYEFSIARTYGKLGEDEKALEWLEKFFETPGRSYPRINYFFEFRKLHNNPRFIKLIRSMGLEPQ